MNEIIIRDYIRALLEDEHDPRVPTQLMSYDDVKDEPGIEAKHDERELEEFSSCGGRAMFGGTITGPFTGVPDARRRKKKHR